MLEIIWNEARPLSLALTATRRSQANIEPARSQEQLTGCSAARQWFSSEKAQQTEEVQTHAQAQCATATSCFRWEYLSTRPTRLKCADSWLPVPQESARDIPQEKEQIRDQIQGCLELGPLKVPELAQHCLPLKIYSRNRAFRSGFQNQRREAPEWPVWHPNDASLLKEERNQAQNFQKEYQKQQCILSASRKDPSSLISDQAGFREPRIH